MDGIVYRTAKQSEANPDLYVLSTESVDRMGEVISIQGWDLRNFKNNPIALLNHSSNAIIGSWKNVRIDGKRLLGELVLADEGTSERIDEIRRLRQQGHIKAVSVGFRPTEKVPLDKDADPYFGPFKYLKQELVECSLVAVPANPDAHQVSRSLDAPQLPADVQKQLFGKLADNDSRRSAIDDPTGKLARFLPPGTKTTMSLSKKIETAQADRNRLRDALNELVNKDELDESETLQIEELNRKIPEVEKQLAILEESEKNLAARTAEKPMEGQIILPGQPQPRPFAVPAKKVEPMDLMIRSAICTGISHWHRRSIDQVLRERYGNDEATAIVTRAAVDPAKTTVVGWAAELVQTITDGFLNSLTPISIYARLRAMSISLTFDRAGIIRIPARAATPQINGDFVGEGAPIPVRRLALTSIQLTPKKVAVISTFTEEMADFSTPAIESLLREAITEDTAVVLDTKLIDANPATIIRPAGLRNGIAGLTPSAATTAAAAMVADLRALIGALTAVNGGRRVAILINTAQAFSLSMAQTVNGDFLFGSPEEASRKFGVTFIASNSVPAGTVIAVDVADFVTVSGDTPNFDMSNQATIHEEDTTPLPIVDGAGVSAKPVRSLYQTDTMGLRMRMPVNWAMRRAGMVSWMAGVIW
jgi:HK97 family phage prohead protease/HK97 family phage major capsid protein